MTQRSILQPERRTGRRAQQGCGGDVRSRGWRGADRGRALLFSCY